MGRIIKFQHEAYNGLQGNEQDFDILYPKTSVDQIEGLQAYVESLLTGTSGAKNVKSVAFTGATSSTAPKIKITFQDDTFIESNLLTIATSAVYGVTKLSSLTNSTVENVAATPKAVKTAFDLATTANSKAEEVISMMNNVATFLNGMIQGWENHLQRILWLTDIDINPGKKYVLNLKTLKIDPKYITDIIGYYYAEENSGAIIKDGISVGWYGSELYVISSAEQVNALRILYQDVNFFDNL